MEVHNLKTRLITLGLLLSHLLFAQPNDCRRSIVICDDRPIMFTPKFGSGSNDFLSTKNSKGCLQRGENISVWFYFEFRKDMPIDSGKLAFTLSDSVQFRGQDFDFAIYGPKVNCDSLGVPVRCSFAQINPNQRIIRTGLGNGAADKSEGLEGDGYLDTLRVKPGDGYFMLIDFFVGIGSTFDSAVALSFNLTWGGPAAPYLNCIANPNCDIASVDARPDTTICAGFPFSIEAKAYNTSGRASIRWTAAGEAGNFIAAPDSFKTSLVFPAGLAGLYSFTSTVSEGNCVLKDEVLVNVLPAPLPIIRGDSLLCNGKTATLLALPGFMQYRWSSGEKDVQSISISAAGRYSLSVTGSNGCIGVATFDVRNKIAVPLKIFGDTVLCPGEQAFLAADAGFADYQWSTGSREPAVVISDPGTYFLTVTDKDGCSTIRPFEIRGIKPLAPVISGKDYFCKGTSAKLTASPGFESYRWSDGSTADTLKVSAAGIYRVTVSDRDGCQTDAAFQIAERQNPAIYISGDTTFCKGAGTFLKAPPGISGYFWSSGSRDSMIQVFDPGKYTLSIEDTFRCVGTASVFVDTLSLPKTAFSGPSVLCEGQFGRITPGDFAFYRWSTGDVLPDIPVVRSGLYRVTVTGFNGCTAADSFQVTIFPNPVPRLLAPGVICPGTSVDLQVQGTYARYLWNSGDTTASIQKDRAGVYEVQVTDKNGCTGSSSTEIKSVPSPELEIRGSASVCEGDTARLFAQKPFSRYLWSTGEESPYIETVKPGIFTLSVKDSNGCQALDSFSVQLLKNPPVAIAGPLKFCQGSFTTIKVPGGYPRYNWSNGSRDSLLRVFQPGQYRVTVTNTEGCSRSSSVFVRSESPVAPLLAPGRYQVCQDTVKRLEAGPGFISYTWSNGSSQPYIDVAEAGEYSLTVLDSNLCISTVFFDVSVIPVAPPEILGLDSFCQGLRVPLIASSSKYTSLLWSTGEQQNTIYITREGTYTLQVTDLNGCVSSSSKTVGIKPAPPVKIVGDLEICRGEQTILSVTGKFTFFEWSNGSTDTTLTIAQPGPYGVSARGENGCIGTDKVEVRQSRIPFPIIEGDRFFCSNDSIALEVEAGFKNYTWNTGQGGNRIFVRREGTYGVTVTDDLGCDGKAQVRVFTNPAPESRISGKLIFCPGDSVLLSGDPGFVRYRWSANTEEKPQIWVKTPGWYTLEVEAENKCTDRDSVLVQHAPVPGPKIRGNPFLCADSAAWLSIADTFAYFRWGNGETGPQLAIQAAGLYSISVSNDFGCSGFDTLRVVPVPAPIANAGPDTFLTCIRRELRIGINPPSSTMFLKAQWQGPDINTGNRNSFMPMVRVPGRYQLTLTDTVHNCPSLPAFITVRDSAYTPMAKLIAEDSLNCKSPEIFLNAGGTVSGRRFRYLWQDIDRGIHLNSDSLRARISLPGNYTFTVTDTLFGCSNSRSIQIGIDTTAPRPAILPADTLNCSRTTVNLQAAVPPIGQSWSYNWAADPGRPTSFNPNNTQYPVQIPGAYYLWVQNRANGCTGSTSVVILIDTVPPKANGGADQELDCLSRETTLRGIDPNPRWKYQWRDAATGFILARAAELTLELPGVYLFEAIDPKNGCIAKDSVKVSMNSNAPVGLAFVVSPETCAGRTDGQLRVLNVKGGTPPYIYRLSGSSSFSAGPQFKGLKPGNYRITLQDAQGCELSDRFEIFPGIDARLNLGNDLTIKLGERIQLSGQTNIPTAALAKVQWIKPDTLKNRSTLTVSVSPVTTTTYVATVQDTNGCSATDSLIVNVEQSQRVFFPSAFSPNGDGANDVFMVFAGPEVTRIKSLRLFNRWGILMYEQFDFPPNDPAFGWTGVHRGILQNPAVYVFYAEVEFLDGSVAEFKGDFALIR